MPLSSFLEGICYFKSVVIFPAEKSFGNNFSCRPTHEYPLLKQLYYTVIIFLVQLHFDIKGKRAVRFLDVKIRLDCCAFSQIQQWKLEQNNVA